MVGADALKWTIAGKIACSRTSYAAAALAETGVGNARRMLEPLTRAHLVHVTGSGRYGMHDTARLSHILYRHLQSGHYLDALAVHGHAHQAAERIGDLVERAHACATWVPPTSS